MPMIEPSFESSGATVCPHGSLCASCRSSNPLSLSSSAAATTASASCTSNSMLTCGTGRSDGHSSVPRHAWAAWASGQTPKCLLPQSARCGNTHHQRRARAEALTRRRTAHDSSSVRPRSRQRLRSIRRSQDMKTTIRDGKLLERAGGALHDFPYVRYARRPWCSTHGFSPRVVIALTPVLCRACSRNRWLRGAVPGARVRCRRSGIART
jgi:hypothetical protein